MANPVTLKEVARSAGVSVATASQALNSADFFLSLVDGFSTGAQARELQPLVLTFAKTPATERDLPSVLRHRELDGILLTGDLTPATRDLFASLDIPCVLLGNEEPTGTCTVIKPDGAAALPCSLVAAGSTAAVPRGHPA
jgi:DNA-binding LacI/PurR family transcriptional regulator